MAISRNIVVFFKQRVAATLAMKPCSIGLVGIHTIFKHEVELTKN